MVAGVDLNGLSSNTVSFLEKTIVDDSKKTYYILTCILQALGKDMKAAWATLNEDIAPLLFNEESKKTTNKAATLDIVDKMDTWVLQIDRKSIEQAAPKEPLL